MPAPQRQPRGPQGATAQGALEGQVAVLGRRVDGCAQDAGQCARFLQGTQVVQAVDLLQARYARYYIKNDLAVFLPAGYIKAVGYDPYASKPARPVETQSSMF